MKGLLIIMRKVIAIFLIIASIIFVLNFEVSTRQGVDYQVRILKMPLYLKLLDFFDRHFNYKMLVKDMIKDAKTEEEKALSILEWTYQNIEPAPEGMPIMDDHVWYTIVRGYGVHDQFQDVFTTLCNYVGLKAFFYYVYSQDRTQRIPLSFVCIKDKWVAFDAYAGVYFKDKDGKLVDIEAIKSNEWTVEYLGKDLRSDIDYSIYIDSFPSGNDAGLTRANTQSPLNRLLFEIKKRIKN